MDFSAAEVSLALAACEPHQPCLSCGQTLLQEQAAEVQFSPGTFSQFGTEYHLRDFVYVRHDSDSDCIFDLAQVEDIQCKQSHGHDDVIRVQVKIRYLGRVDRIMRRERKGKEFEDESHPQDEVSIIF